uniref:RasGEF domain family, member 1B n=1 Tax=Mus musculus TaxID=10090 RepID=E0CXU2_MOUSE
MAKFLAALLGCTLPSKGASPVLEVTSSHPAMAAWSLELVCDGSY